MWEAYEETVSDFAGLNDAILRMSKAAKKSGRRVAWRGQADSLWGLQSKLHRDLLSLGAKVDEDSIANKEKELLKGLREWGLHARAPSGRLSVLYQLAMLQHFGSPTRLIDISFNANIAAFFATETHDNLDGRIFAIDIKDRLIGDSPIFRKWEDALDTPWSGSFIEQEFKSLPDEDQDQDQDDVITLKKFKKLWKMEWTGNYFAWKPPSLDNRISAQNGGFIFGGLVGAQTTSGLLDPTKQIQNPTRFQIQNPYRESPADSPFKGKKDGPYLPISDTRDLTSLAIKPQKFPQGTSTRANTVSAVYTIRIEAKAKKDIKEMLRYTYGIEHATIYPDFGGYAEFVRNSKI